MSCDLPAKLDLLPGEVDLLETWFAEMIADLSGGGGTAVSNSDSEQAKEIK